MNTSQLPNSVIPCTVQSRIYFQKQFALLDGKLWNFPNSKLIIILRNLTESENFKFIFSLQKIRSFWYNASFEFFCQILWVYNYFALKRVFFLVIACMKDPHRRIFVEDFCCLIPIFLRPQALHFQLFPHNLITRGIAFLF